MVTIDEVHGLVQRLEGTIKRKGEEAPDHLRQMKAICEAYIDLRVKITSDQALSAMSVLPRTFPDERCIIVESVTGSMTSSHLPNAVTLQILQGRHTIETKTYKVVKDE